MNLKYNKSYSRPLTLCRMLPGGNTLACWVAVLGLLLAGSGLAQDAGPEMAREDAVAAFKWAQDWVRSEKGVPADEQLADRPVSGLFGVCVTLRESGRVLGRGQAVREDVSKAVDQAGPAVQMAPLVAAATRQALEQVRDKQMKRAVELKITDPELFEQGLLATRERLHVDIQLGYGLQSIVLPVEADEAAVFTAYAPGYHGLRMAGPLAGRADYAWPATELARNNSPARTLINLLDKQGYEAGDIQLVARGDGPALQRFKVLHMVRPGTAQPMRELVRGNLFVPQQVIDRRTLSGLSERVARYLDQLFVQVPGVAQYRVRGVYQPSMMQYSPAWSEPRQAALACYALSRYAHVANEDAHLRGREAMLGRSKRVLRLIEQLEPDALPEAGKPKHLTASFLLLAMCELPVKLTPQQAALRDRLGEALVALRHPDGGGYRVMAGEDKKLTRVSAAVVTAALAAWYEQTRDRKLIDPVWSVLGDLMKVNKDDAMVSDLVWVSHAVSKAGELMAQKHPDPEAAAKDLAAWRGILAEQLELLSEQQIVGKPVMGPRDVTGGFILEPAPPGSPPNPNWQSAMPLTIVAIGLRDKQIVKPERSFGPMLTAQLGARFIGQLMMTEPSAYYLRDAGPVLGGIRGTLWDNTLYPDYSSMALLALTELQHTLWVLRPEGE